MTVSGGVVTDIAQDASAPPLAPTMPVVPLPAPDIAGADAQASSTLVVDVGTIPRSVDDTTLSLQDDPVLHVTQPRFVCEASLGRLVRWLRVIGVDAGTIDY